MVGNNSLGYAIIIITLKSYICKLLGLFRKNKSIYKFNNKLDDNTVNNIYEYEI